TLVYRFLSSYPTLRILATSRQSLGLIGERGYRVPSLPLPSTGHVEEKEIASLLDYAGVRLFVERGAQVQPSFRLTRRNAPTVVQVCQDLDGIPLALELAAARLRSLSVKEIATHLDERFRLLTGGSRLVLRRHQTLRALIDWSYDLLDEQEQALLHRLSA